MSTVEGSGQVDSPGVAAALQTQGAALQNARRAERTNQINTNQTDLRGERSPEGSNAASERPASPLALLPRPTQRATLQTGGVALQTGVTLQTSGAGKGAASPGGKRAPGSPLISPTALSPVPSVRKGSGKRGGEGRWAR